MSGFHIYAASALACIFHDELVRHESYKLAVCGLVVLAVDVVAEKLIDVLDSSARPGDLYGMAYGALDL